MVMMLDRFLETDRFANVFQNGWQVRLQPLRASGSWPGLDPTIPSSREAPYEGPTAVLTLGRLRARRAVNFFQTSARAEAQILESPGLIWATGMGLPPFVGTCSLWRDSASLMSYAYGTTNSHHGAAIACDRRDTFHHTSAFGLTHRSGSSTVRTLSPPRGSTASSWMLSHHVDESICRPRGRSVRARRARGVRISTQSSNRSPKNGVALPHDRRRNAVSVGSGGSYGGGSPLRAQQRIAVEGLTSLSFVAQAVRDMPRPRVGEGGL